MISGLEPVDVAFLETLVPTNGYCEELVVVLKFIRHDGTPAFKTWTPSDSDVSVITGLLEVGKLQLLAEADAFEAWTDGDD